MTFFLEFFLTFIFPILFSFLLAKLFSVYSSSTSNKSDDDHVSVLSQRELFEAELKKNDSGDEGRIGFVSEVDQKIGNRETLNDSCGLCNDFKIGEGEVLREFSEGKFGGVSEFEDKLVDESTESQNIAKIEEELTKHEAGVSKSEEIVVSESECDDKEILEANKNEEDGRLLCDCEEILVDESTESKNITKIEEDWTKYEVGESKSEEIVVSKSECDNEIIEANKNEEDGRLLCDCEEILVDESTESKNITKIEEDWTKYEVGESKSEEIVVSKSECDNEIIEANKNEEDGRLLCDCEEILVDESTESDRINRIESELCKNETVDDANKNGEDGVKEALFDEDDDWEGVERTELERLFGSVVAFVGSKSNVDQISRLDSLVKLQLYGLHKIATQGPCHEPQPMALKVSARANWNAWKSFENMTREDAMEQYVTILSRSIPGCIQDDINGDSKRVSADSEACSKLHSDLKAWQMNKVGPVDERNVDEPMPSFEGLDVTKSSIQMP
ncbi:hypothetical protein Dsin_008383 [Dipteronia sinensis]|uniref:ACB domain-containing protein n=1 Tax=Dipteronia sinensis TaxID=43782 RepID=A0AAE0AP27_9ROSI|nr:hypothetical protein Dsin_008383 [Dipteronia sinensis]